jgi:Flp pilus assembly CpaE family ATPase
MMQTTEHALSPRGRMQAMRARLRAAGLRPVQIWVPDVRMPRIAREAERQSRLASRHAAEADALAFIGAAADTGEEP